MEKRSCLTNLLEFLEEVTIIIDKGHSLDLLFLDFAKAFDKVPHQRLLDKIKAHGVQDKVLGWIQAWLSSRKQRVVLNGAVSQWEDVCSGVPQGSVLGPTLFIVFINDIDDAVDTVNGIIKKFADDARQAVFKEVKQLHD